MKRKTLSIISASTLVMTLILIVIGCVLAIVITVSEEVSETMVISSILVPAVAIVFNTISMVARWKEKCMSANDADER